MRAFHPPVVLASLLSLRQFAPHSLPGSTRALLRNGLRGCATSYLPMDMRLAPPSNRSVEARSGGFAGSTHQRRYRRAICRNGEWLSRPRKRNTVCTAAPDASALMLRPWIRGRDRACSLSKASTEIIRSIDRFFTLSPLGRSCSLIKNRLSWCFPDFAQRDLLNWSIAH